MEEEGYRDRSKEQTIAEQAAVIDRLTSEKRAARRKLLLKVARIAAIVLAAAALVVGTFFLVTRVLANTGLRARRMAERQALDFAEAYHPGTLHSHMGVVCGWAARHGAYLCHVAGPGFRLTLQCDGDPEWTNNGCTLDGGASN